MTKCANEALSENIGCTANPDQCMFVMDKNCTKVMLEDACTVSVLKNVSTISMSDNGDASIVDPNLSVNEEDCM